MKKVILMLTFLSLITMAVKAQKDNEKNDRVESYKIAFITERLDLTPKEAAAFWPVYNEYNDQVKKLRAKDRERSKVYKEKTAPTDQDSEKFITEYLAFKQQEQELMRKYMVEFKKVLPIVKVAKLVTLEQEFKMQLLQQLKDKDKK